MSELAEERTALRNFLEANPFEVPERFQRCAQFLHANSQAFFVGSRLSHNFSQQFAIFRRAIQEIPLEGEEARIYRPWTELQKANAVKLGLESPSISNELVGFLKEAEDPAVMIIASLEQIRIQEFPDVGREAALISAAFRSYDLFLSSVHGPRLDEILHS